MVYIVTKEKIKLLKLKMKDYADRQACVPPRVLDETWLPLLESIEGELNG